MHKSVDIWARRMQALDYSPVHRAKAVRAVELLYRATGARSPAGITADALERYLDAQPSAKTAANKRSQVGAYLDWCVGRKLVRTNVARAVRTRRPRPGKGADILRPAQLRLVLRHLHREQLRAGTDRRCTAWYRALAYRFLWSTMLRVSEMHALRWSDVDLEARTLRLPADKARRADALPLAPGAVAVLEELRRGARALPARASARTGHVFPLTVCPHQVHRDFGAVGIDGRGVFHRLRKGGITACIEAGVPVHVLAKLSRHANVSVLVQSYYVAADPTLRKAQQALRIGAA